MKENGITRAELADRLGKSESFVSQVLSGHRNMTLETLADIAYTLDLKVKVDFGRDDWVGTEPLKHPGQTL
ncbi:MAG: helix-turn-helix transcriptional regulator [Magnetococcales bacterium]|nr:helix-turn-helix transcriptional regulator [Magnetococcales bacterium]MBF0321730.1 helix-turn-helix transcriptional regulator [Magnetococcales bacterium]